MGHSLFYFSRLQLSLLKTKPNLQVKLLLFSLFFFGENGRGWSFPCLLLLFLILEICLQLWYMSHGNLLRKAHKSKSKNQALLLVNWPGYTSVIGWQNSNRFMSCPVCWSMTCLTASKSEKPFSQTLVYKSVFCL